MKPGYATTEFYITLFLAFLGSAMTTGLIPEGSVWFKVAGGIIAAAAAVGYTVSRGLAKKPS